MTNSHLLILLEESAHSPEALGSRIGISGMSIRRWLKNPADASIPEPYASAFQALIQKMVIEGRLAGTSRSAIWAFGEIGEVSPRASIAALGVDLTSIGLHSGDTQSVVSVLEQLGRKPEAEREISERSELIKSHQKSDSGRETNWSKAIGHLLTVVRSASFTRIEKSVAIGALFYLVFLFDLIPDTIPIFGLVDDFAIVGIASAYYRNRQTSPEQGL